MAKRKSLPKPANKAGYAVQTSTLVKDRLCIKEEAVSSGSESGEFSFSLASKSRSGSSPSSSSSSSIRRTRSSGSVKSGSSLFDIDYSSCADSKTNKFSAKIEKQPKTTKKKEQKRTVIAVKPKQVPIAKKTGPKQETTEKKRKRKRKTRVLAEIRKLQKSTKLLIPKAPFVRLVSVNFYFCLVNRTN